MAGFLTYDLLTGYLTRTGIVPDGEELAQAQVGEGAMVNDDPTVSGSTHWVSLGPPPVLVAKPAMATSIDKTYISANLTQIATITGVPQGAELLVNGVDKGRVDDGTVTFSAAAVGIYTLLLTHYRYRDQTYLVGVGMIQLPAATETEYAINVTVPLPPAIEIETALNAGQLRTAQLPCATETESAPVAVMSRNVNLDPAIETEYAIDVAALLPPAIETESAPDAVASRNADLPAATETETAFDVAA